MSDNIFHRQNLKIWTFGLWTIEIGDLTELIPIFHIFYWTVVWKEGFATVEC